MCKKGQVIARLDREQLLHQRETAAGRLSTGRRRSWPRAQSALKWQRETMAADLQVAQRRFERRRAAVAAIEKRRAAAGDPAIPGRGRSPAQSRYDQAKKDWERAQKLYKDDDISTSQYDQFRNSLRERRGDFEAGQGTGRPGAGRAAHRNNRGRREARWSARAPR